MSSDLGKPIVEVAVLDGPLGKPTSEAPAGAGAWLVFEGIVRPLEEGRRLVALVYEAYPPMTERELRRLAAETAAEQGLLAIHVEHSVGWVGVDEISFRLSIGSRHRVEGIAATDKFIHAMKRDVPLWKNPVWAPE